jgi:hypothetical protein
MINTRFYLELQGPASSWAALEKKIDMPYKVAQGEAIQISFDNEGELDFVVESIYFDITLMELTAHLNVLALQKEAEFTEIVADFVKIGWTKQ